MAKGKFSKQPYEEFTISVPFGKNMVTGETITTQTAIAVDTDAVDASSAVLKADTLSNTGQTVTVLVRAGEVAKSPYQITIRCVTSLGHKWEKDIVMKVVEE